MPNPTCCGKPMHKAGFATLYRDRKPVKVQAYRCPLCGRRTIKTEAKR